MIAGSIPRGAAMSNPLPIDEADFRNRLREVMANTLMSKLNSTLLYDHGYDIADAILEMPEMKGLQELTAAVGALSFGSPHDKDQALEQAYDRLPMTLWGWEMAYHTSSGLGDIQT